MLDFTITTIEFIWPIGVITLCTLFLFRMEKKYGHIKNLSKEKLLSMYHNASLFALSLMLCLLALEGVCRLTMEPEYHRRAAVPLWGQGNFENNRSIREIKEGQNGPRASGYKELLNGSYQYNPQTELSPHWREEWLYNDQYRSKYLLSEVQRITETEPQSIRIFVNGGSVAAGTGSSSTENSWHIVLETMLRKELGREDVYVFNCAVGAFVTSQERLSFDRAIAPFITKGVIVINVNGYNDIGAMTAPGDPMLVGRMYSNDMGEPLLKALRTHSYLGRLILDRLSDTQRKNLRDEFLGNKARVNAMVQSVANVYEENTRHQMRIGRLLEAQTFTFFQPWTSISASESGVHVNERIDSTPKEVLEYQQQCRDEISHRLQDESGWIDLSSLFSAPELVATYTDSCHFTDKGHKVLAQAVFEILLPQIQESKIAQR